MATIADLNAKADALQAALDAEQDQIAKVIGDLKKANADLQAIIDAGGVVTAADLDALSAKLDASITDLSSTVPDAPIVPPTEPANP